MQTSLEQAKLSFACSSVYSADYDDCNFDDVQKAYMDSIDDDVLKQTVKDYLLNTQFRRDYWVKGAKRLGDDELCEYWSNLSVMAVKNSDDISSECTNHRTAIINEPMLDAIKNILKDKKVHQVGHLMTALKDNMTPKQLFAILALLMSKSDVVLVQPQQVVDAVKPYCDRLNRYVLQQSLDSDHLGVLASPVTGMGMRIDRVSQFFVLAYLDGGKPNTWTDFVWQIFQRKDMAVLKDGKPADGDKQAIELLDELNKNFVKETLPLLKALQILT